MSRIVCRKIRVFWYVDLEIWINGAGKEGRKKASGFGTNPKPEGAPMRGCRAWEPKPRARSLEPLEVELRADSSVPRRNNAGRPQPGCTRRREGLRPGRHVVAVHDVVDVDPDLGSRPAKP